MATLDQEIHGNPVGRIMSYINRICNDHQLNDLIAINKHLKMLIRQAGVIEIAELEVLKSIKGYVSWNKEYLGNIYGDTIRIIFEGNDARTTLVYQIATKRLIADESFAFAINYL